MACTRASACVALIRHSGANKQDCLERTEKFMLRIFLQKSLASKDCEAKKKVS
jgi:hypothetical protein